VADTTVAVIDLETTGLSAAGGAAILELAVVRVTPGREPELVLDTLVNPEGPVRGTRIHGILDDEVIGAPTFAQIAPMVHRALAEAVVAAYNASFDMGFLTHYGAAVGLARLPYVCLMYLRPLLGLGRRCALEEACAEHGVTPTEAHSARGDALAEAALWSCCRDHMLSRGVESFGALGRLGSYKFLQSLAFAPLTSGNDPGPNNGAHLLPRSPRPARLDPTTATRRYRQALLAYLADGVLTPLECDALRRIGEKLWLRADDRDELHREMADELERQRGGASVAPPLAATIALLRRAGGPLWERE
jgi:DNA polymerase III epsilon subunit-like protein